MKSNAYYFAFTDPRLVQARRTLLDLYIKSHIAWIDVQVERMSSEIYEMLHGLRWDDMVAQLLVWEGGFSEMK